MLTKFEEGITFTLIELLEVEDILIECHCLLHVIRFDSDVIASVHLHRCSSFPVPLLPGKLPRTVIGPMRGSALK